MTGTNWLEAYWLKLVFGLKSEAARFYLNYLWWLLEPVLFAAVLYVIFGIFFSRGGEGFFYFLLCGKIPFLWFSKSVSNSANAVTAGRGLIGQMAIPKIIFPLLVVGQDLVKQGVVFAALFVFLVIAGFGLHWTWLALPMIMLTQLALVVATSLFVAAVTPFVPDFRYLVSTGMMMLMLGSGIFYDYRKILLEAHQDYFLMNPVASLLVAYRSVLLEHQWPDWTRLGWILLGSLLVVYLMVRHFQKRDTAYAMAVIQ